MSTTDKVQKELVFSGGGVNKCIIENVLFVLNAFCLTLAERRNRLKPGRRSCLLFMAGFMLMPTVLFAGTLDNRWFYSSLHPWVVSEWTQLTNVVETASMHGYNGIVLSAHYENSCRWSATNRRAARAFSDYCRERGIEVIPLSWSIGYNAMLHIDPNLAEGMLVGGLRYRVSADGRRACFDPEESNVLSNRDFEETRASPDGIALPAGWETPDNPGKSVVLDAEIRHSGRTSVRLTDFASCGGQVRIKQRIRLERNRQYVLSGWFRAEGFYPNDRLFVQGYAVRGNAGGSGLVSRSVFPNAGERLKALTNDWTKISQTLFADDDGMLDLWIGVWGGIGGTVWIDDLTIRDVGLPGVIRRSGCPFVVRGSSNGVAYEEGRDFDAVAGITKLQYGADEQSVSLSIPAGSRMRPGESLLVSGYAPITMGYTSQESVCMRARRFYDLVDENVADLVSLLDTKTWFVGCDEIRHAGTCASCSAYLENGGTLGELLAMGIAKVRESILKHQPGSRIVIWNDMFSPLMNATRPFHLNPEPFGTKGVDKLPKDVIVADWHCGRLKEDMDYFTGRGFTVVGALFYDAKDLVSSEANLRICLENPNCRGAIYTTWRKDYRLLADFGDMMREMNPTPETKE